MKCHKDCEYCVFESWTHICNYCVPFMMVGYGLCMGSFAYALAGVGIGLLFYKMSKIEKKIENSGPWY